jgi:polyribonucleotide nucleotidyltransferase
VSLKGASECVEAAKQRIAQIVDELNNRVTIDVIIQQKHHRTIMGKGGSKVQQIQSDYNVEIKFPDRKPDGPSEEEAPEETDEIKESDIIHVTGRPDNCEGAKQALLDQVPVIVEVDVPFEMHRFIIGQRGKDVREYMRLYDVNITVPPPDQNSNTIVIVGSPKSAAAAKEALLEKRTELEAQKADKEAKSFEVRLQVDRDFHPKIIGKRGAKISEIRKEYDVIIQLPKKDDPDEDIITITGYEDKALAARDAIMGIVNELSDRQKVDVEIDNRVHSRIIGSRGKNVRQIMNDFGVEIRFPRADEPNPNLVSISGNDIDKIYDARDFLLNREEEYIQDVTDNEYMQQFVRDSNPGKETGKKDKQSNGFVVKGAPWEHPPDTESKEEFPSFGNGLGSTESSMSRPLSSVWGPRKHF